MVDIRGLVQPDELRRVQCRGHLVQRRHQLGRGRLRVDRGDDVVGVLQVLVVREDDQLVPGHRRASAACGVAGRCLGSGGAGLAAARRETRGGQQPDQAQGEPPSTLHD